MKKEFSFKSTCRNIAIHAVEWTCEEYVKIPKAVVQLSHGMSEHILRYDDFARFLNENGIYVCGNDHLGHGDSIVLNDDYGYFYDLNAHEKLVDDLYTLNKITKKKYPDIPYILFGHSMGSFLAREYAQRYGNSIDGAIFMGTGQQSKISLHFAKKMCKILANKKKWNYRSPLMYFLAFSSFNKRIKDSNDNFAWLSTEKSVVEKYNSDKKCGFMFTLNGFYNVLDLLLYIINPKHIDNIPKNLRILILSGLEDPAGSYGKNVIRTRDGFKNAGIKNVDMKLYKGARHELLNESIKSDVYNDILNWILK